MRNATCKNCGGDAGLHHYETDQCPVGGREAPIGHKQEWKTTTYEPEDSVSATVYAQAQTIERLADALESLEIYIRHAASGVDIRWHNVNADEGADARALLAEIRGAK